MSELNQWSEFNRGAAEDGSGVSDAKGSLVVAGESKRLAILLIHTFSACAERLPLRAGNTGQKGSALKKL